MYIEAFGDASMRGVFPFANAACAPAVGSPKARKARYFSCSSVNDSNFDN
jgi:hypothetical protein